MQASDVMVSNVISVTVDASVQEVVETLLRNRISAVPVLNEDGGLVGIVSEGDLMRRPESGTERRPSLLQELFFSNVTRASDYARSHSRRVADVMTRDVITASPDTPLVEIASALERNSIKRVPIVQNGKVVGIVSRANLLQALASAKNVTAPPRTMDDATIRREVVKELNRQSWTSPTLINVIVQDGAVDLWGVVESQAELNAVRVLAETIPGVRAVNNNLAIHRIVAGT